MLKWELDFYTWLVDSPLKFQWEIWQFPSTATILTVEQFIYITALESDTKKLQFRWIFKSQVWKVLGSVCGRCLKQNTMLLCRMKHRYPYPYPYSGYIWHSISHNSSQTTATISGLCCYFRTSYDCHRRAPRPYFVMLVMDLYSRG